MERAKLRIKKNDDVEKLYVFRSEKAGNINSISKIKDLVPVMSIDQSLASTDASGNYFVVYDANNQSDPGITYNGPEPNIVPYPEYSTSVKVEKLNDHTYANVISLEEIPMDFDGKIFYYSVIGVNESSNTITHLSKVNGISLDINAIDVSKIEIQSSEDGSNWNNVGVFDYSTTLQMGNVLSSQNIQDFGYPLVETLPPIEEDKIRVYKRMVNITNFMVLEIPNPWCKNNNKYNHRLMKSFRVRNIIGFQSSEWSTPTYQSLLPMPLERMVILRKTDKDVNDPITVNDDEAEVFTIIRRDGIFYSTDQHKHLGVNHFLIPAGADTAVFNEASVQESIKIQFIATPGHKYNYTIYLQDLYEHYSEPVDIEVTT